MYNADYHHDMIHSPDILHLVLKRFWLANHFFYFHACILKSVAYIWSEVVPANCPKVSDTALIGFTPWYTYIKQRCIMGSSSNFPIVQQPYVFLPDIHKIQYMSLSPILQKWYICKFVNSFITKPSLFPHADF